MIDRCAARVVGLFLLTVIAAAGCNRADSDMKPVYPVEGSLFVKGKPAKGAAVTFHPLPLDSVRGTTLTPRATVSDDGSFRLATYNTDDGAPEGEYAVTIYWPGKRGGNANQDADPLDLPPDQLGLRYTDPATSTIKIEVKAPRTHLPSIQLR
jgi:hypothetical protein